LQYSIGRKERWLLLEEIIESNLCVAHIDCGEHERAVNDPRHAHTNRALLPQRKSRKQSQKQKATQAQNARKNVFLVRRGRKGVTRFERRAPGKKVASNLKPQIHRDLFNLHQPKHVFVWLPELQRRADRNRIPVRRSMSTYCPFRGRNSALRTYRKSEIVRQMNQGFDVRARVLLANPGMLDRQTVQRFAL
jgi:hypothetical protein